MAKENRPVTWGNTNVDMTALRADIKKLNPVVQSTLNNAVTRNGKTIANDEVSGKSTINPHKLTKLSNIISNNINAAVDLRVITPYIDKAELIWNSIILFPNGRQEKVLTYDTKPSKLKNAKLHDEILVCWDNYFTNDYKIDSELRPMLNDIMWNTGSYTLFNLSRPGLDYLINGSEMHGRTGQEAFEMQQSFLTQARTEVEREFIKKDDRYVARNLGRFVRSPDKSATAKSISGLESILGGNQPTYAGEEFSLFAGSPEGEDIFNITFTDNPALLYLQKLNAVQRVENVNSIMGVENLDMVIGAALAGAPKEPDPKEKPKSGKNDKDDKEAKGPKEPKATTRNLTSAQADSLAKQLFPVRNIGTQAIQFVKTDDTLKAQTFGRGLTWHVPSEAVIPIHRQGNTGKKTDFIFLLDDEGNFLKNTSDVEFYQSKKTTNDSAVNKSKSGSTNSLITNLKTMQEGKDCDFDMTEFAQMAETSLIRQFLASVIGGDGNNMSISIDEETNKIFLSRMFKSQGVRCLYVPGESVTYMALKYNRLGIGQSLTQAAKMHIARLAAYDVADAMANLEAAQPHTLMSINIAKEDPDPAHTIAVARSTFFEANPRVHNILAVAQLSIPQIVDSIRESSLTIKINSEDNPHVAAPDIDLAPMEKQVFKSIDPSSREEVLNKISNYFGLPRSWLDVVDDGQNNFQIEALTEHQMLMNQGANWQAQFADQLVDHMRKHVSVNAPLLNELVKIIVSNKALWKPDSGDALEGTDQQKIKMILADFFNNVFCKLPTPTSTDNITKLKDKLEAVDALVQAWEGLSGYSAMLAPMAATLGLDTSKYNTDEIKAAVKAAFVTDAFKRFNLPMPFDEIVSEGKGGGMASLVNAIVYQRANIGEFLAKFVTDVAKEDKKLIKTHLKKIADALAALEAATPEPEPEETEMSGLDGSDPLDGGDDTPPVVDDDLGLDDGDDTPPPGDDEEPAPGDDETDTPPKEDAGTDGLDPALNNPDEDPFSTGKK